MLKEWQFDVLFFVGVGGAIVMLIGPSIGLDIGQNPTAVTGIGAILTYILTQRKALTKNGKNGEHSQAPNGGKNEPDRTP